MSKCRIQLRQPSLPPPAATPHPRRLRLSIDPALADLSPGIPDPSEPTVVTFASWVGGGQTWLNLAEQFHELHPNITIEFQDVPFEEIRTKLLTQVAANNPPDVAYMDASSVGEFAARNALVNLDDFIAGSNAIDQFSNSVGIIPVSSGGRQNAHRSG